MIDDEDVDQPLARHELETELLLKRRDERGPVHRHGIPVREARELFECPDGVPGFDPVQVFDVDDLALRHQPRRRPADSDRRLGLVINAAVFRSPSD